jgi:chloramphenicol-sensitive protein RarD
MNRGIFYALTTYVVWGLMPIFWKVLSAVPALEITAHRIVWSALFTAILLSIGRNWQWLGQALRDRRTMLTFATTAVMIAFHWLIYIIAVNNNKVVETSLAFFIYPLVNVLLAVVFLRERPRQWQWIAIALAALGVLYLTLSYGYVPWISLILAFSFGFYSLLKRTATLAALEGMFLETAVLAPAALGFLLYLERAQAAAFGHGHWSTSLLLVLAGVVTASALVLFSAGARLVPLTVLGLLQYINPTIQFCLGVLVFQEPFSEGQLVGFSFIWMGLAIFTVEGVIERRRVALVPRAP